MLGLFRPREEYIDPCILSVGAVCFVLLGCLLKFSLEFVYHAVVVRYTFTVIWILELYYLD
jgi:hypothetical protein